MSNTKEIVRKQLSLQKIRQILQNIKEEQESEERNQVIQFIEHYLDLNRERPSREDITITLDIFYQENPLFRNLSADQISLCIEEDLGIIIQPEHIIRFGRQF